MKRILACLLAPFLFPGISAQAYPDLYEILDRQKGKMDIEIPKGIYTLDVLNKGAYKFHDLTDVRIYGNGSTIVCNNQELALSFYNCVRVELHDIAIDYDPLCFTQGRVVACAEDGSWFDIEIDEGYPLTGIVPNRVQFYDPDTRQLKRNSITTYSSNYAGLESLGPRLFRARKRGVWSAGEQVGDLVVLDVRSEKKKYSPVHAIQLNKCWNMRLENVTVYGSNTFSIYEKEGYGNEYLHCVVDRGPMPEGLAPRLRSSNADGIHSSQALKGPTVVGCRVHHNGDDCIIVCGRSFPVSRVNVREKSIDLVTQEGYPVFRRGDRLTVIGYDGKRKGELRLLAVSPYDPTEEQRMEIVELYPALLSKTAYRKGFRLKVKDLPFEIQTGDVLFNADAVGSGFVIRDNEVGDVRSRGILIKGVDGIVASNHIQGCAMSGILVSPEIQWMGGGFSSNVRIENNVIEECMFERSNTRLAPGALSLFYVNGAGNIPEAGSLLNITLRGNRVVDCPYPAIVCTSVDGLTYGNNEVSNPSGIVRSHGAYYGADSQLPVWKTNTREK